MNIRKVIIIVVFLLFINNIFYSEENLLKYRKDPFLAGALSFYNPGLGQFYSGESEKGMLFWLGENVLFFSSLLIVTDFTFNFKGDFGVEIKIKQKKNLSDERIITSIGLGVAFLVVHFFNIMDAVDSAKNYNKKLENLYLQDQQISFDFQIKDQRNYIFLKTRF